MSLRCRNSLAVAAACAAVGLLAESAVAEPLGVCADPNNLPYSNARQEGLENALAELVAGALGREGVRYAWHPQRRGFVRNTLEAGRCEVIMGVPGDYELAQPTAPYYRSTYVFVYRASADYEIGGLDDPRLRELKIGVHVVGDDYSSTPGAVALGRRGLVDNLVGYSVYGDYREPHPTSRLIEAVAAGEIDVAVAWGPLAGYFAPRQPVALRVVPVSPRVDGDVPFTFAIAMAVRRGNEGLRARLDDVIHDRRQEIHALLEEYGVPLVQSEATAAHAERIE